jgi:hypothetical protein
VSKRRDGTSVSELEEQIFNREGFRVSFARLGAGDAPIPPYGYRVMAPNGWRVSDWRRIRLAPYVLVFRDVTVYRGDDTPLVRDVKLGHLRDTYYEAEYGTLAPTLPDNVVPLDVGRESGGKPRPKRP